VHLSEKKCYGWQVVQYPPIKGTWSRERIQIFGQNLTVLVKKSIRRVLHLSEKEMLRLEVVLCPSIKGTGLDHETELKKFVKNEQFL
jgi:hypothetical protein